jgi:hypothetical protein
MTRPTRPSAPINPGEQPRKHWALLDARSEVDPTESGEWTRSPGDKFIPQCPSISRTLITNSTKIRFERNTVRSTLERPRSKCIHGGQPIGQTKDGIRPTLGTLGHGGSFFSQETNDSTNGTARKTRVRARWVETRESDKVVFVSRRCHGDAACARFPPRRLFTWAPPAERP